MLIPIRPILAGALLIASHLADPGGATAEFLSAPPLEEQRAIPAGSEEPDNWRLESAIGLAGDS